MSELGTFWGIGVGPGAAGYIPVAAWEALQKTDVIFHPKARHAQSSVARQCLVGLNLSDEQFREVIYNMDTDRIQIESHYARLAGEIAAELRTGKNVAYLTIGDSLTYSTYNYVIKALLAILPDVSHQTFPGITSYAFVASMFDWPLGQGKERTLILPCPDDMADLRKDIESHDIVVLMKIGHRLSSVLALLKTMEITNNCVFGSRVGLPGEHLCGELERLKGDDSQGYLSTMLIRYRPIAAVGGAIDTGAFGTMELAK